MSTYTQDLHQVVFRDKYNQSFLTKQNQEEVFRYMAGILKNKKCHVFAVGGFKNHVHLVFELHPTIALAYLVKDIKRSMDELIKQEWKKYPGFEGWQVGYGSFTYSSSSKDYLVKYAMNQERHHENIDYEEELIALLEKNNLPYDRKYLFI